MHSVNSKNSYNKLAFLDPLKFMGAIMIGIFLHYDEHFLSKLGVNNPLTDNSILNILFTKSFIFVEMFFVISGLLFQVAYMNKIIDKNSPNNSYPKIISEFIQFIAARYKRIFPLVSITTIYMYILGLIVYNSTGKLWAAGSISIWDLISGALIGGGAFFGGNPTLNGPVWYVQILMFCYILSFVITRLTANIRKKPLKSLFFILPILIGIIMRLSALALPLWNEFTARGLIAYFAGIVLGDFLRYFDTLSNVKRIIIRLISLLIIGTILFMVAFKSDYISPITTYVALFLFPEAILLLYDVKWINKICSNNICKTLGRLSFGIYLWNFPILITLHLAIVTGMLSLTVNSPLFILGLLLIHIAVALITDYISKTIGKSHRKQP